MVQKLLIDREQTKKQCKKLKHWSIFQISVNIETERMYKEDEKFEVIIPLDLLFMHTCDNTR